MQIATPSYLKEYIICQSGWNTLTSASSKLSISTSNDSGTLIDTVTGYWPYNHGNFFLLGAISFRHERFLFAISNFFLP